MIDSNDDSASSIVYNTIIVRMILLNQTISMEGEDCVV